MEKNERIGKKRYYSSSLVSLHCDSSCTCYNWLLVDLEWMKNKTWCKNI